MVGLHRLRVSEPGVAVDRHEVARSPAVEPLHGVTVDHDLSLGRRELGDQPPSASTIR